MMRTMIERGPHTVPRGLLRFYILRLLSENPMKGYEVITRIEERTAGFWKPGPGSIYPMLESMRTEGLIRAATTSKKAVSGKSGKMLQISGRGKKALEHFRENAKSRMHSQERTIFRIFGDIIYPGLDLDELVLVERRKDTERLKNMLDDEYMTKISLDKKRKFLEEYAKIVQEELELVEREMTDTEAKE
jgi:DNA-binding PadR family transcriptional regulator